MVGSDRSDDARAVRRCLDGDRDAFAELVERYQRQILLYCHSQILSLSVAEELAQDTFLRAFERLAQLRTHESFRAWLYRIAATSVFSYKRRERDRVELAKAHVEIAGERVAESGVDRATDMRGLAEHALRHLSEGVRAAVVLRVCDELSYRAIAERLHVDPAAAETRVRRGLAAMREHLVRIGREEDARDVLARGIAGALVGSDIVATVMRGVADMADPTATAAPRRELATSAALALALVGTVFVGIGAAATGSRGSDAPIPGDRAPTTLVTSVSDLQLWASRGALGPGLMADGPAGALYDFESGDLSGWTGLHYNRRLDRFHTVSDSSVHVYKQTLDNPAIAGSRGLRFQKQNRGSYLLSSLTSPEFGPLAEPFTAQWDVLLGDDNYGMYLSEQFAKDADAESGVKVAGVYFSGGALTGVARGYPRLGSYRPDSLFHVRIDARPDERRFDLSIQGDLRDTSGQQIVQVDVRNLMFTPGYRGEGLRRLTFVMGRAARGQYNLDSQIILDNIVIEPLRPEARDLVAEIDAL